jgi:hypothetical protein
MKHLATVAVTALVAAGSIAGCGGSSSASHTSSAASGWTKAQQNEFVHECALDGGNGKEAHGDCRYRLLPCVEKVPEPASQVVDEYNQAELNGPTPAWYIDVMSNCAWTTGE